MKEYVDNIIGSDEVGVGDYFGPLVVCGVKIPKNNIRKIESLNIKDSKALSDEKIKQLSMELAKFVEYRLRWFVPYTYNKQFEEYKNSHILKTILHNQVHAALEFENCKHIIDAFASKENYLKYLNKTKETNKIVDVILEEKAENKYLQVACASILARSWFIKWFDEYENKNSKRLPYGASNDVKKIVSSFNDKELYQICKMHFKI